MRARLVARRLRESGVRAWFQEVGFQDINFLGYDSEHKAHLGTYADQYADSKINVAKQGFKISKETTLQCTQDLPPTCGSHTALSPKNE